ncbi:Far1-related sequence 3 [Quillaja saponaria]|uniref:Far1-related sequence 3 n=1 Tax=Quillaja saponaria TaxID=32244 RepID=A0AAD7VI26_QUISA|nr:Far1-related sequence 3 [Quillaja saponaria]
MEADSLYMNLHKLSGIKSEEALDHLFTTLWKSRKTGLRSSEKSHLQSLLNLSSLPEVDPVLACLRSLIRKFVHENFSSDDLLKLFPPDMPLDLQSILILSLQKCQNQWKEDISKEQHLLPRTSISYQVKANVPPSFTPLDSSENLTSLWPREDDIIAGLNHNELGASTPLIADVNASGMAPLSFQPDIGPDNLGILPRLKSMTWTLENRNTAQANRVAVISLKLHDYSKSPSGESEVKFQLTKDTLEAMLRSMTYISEQLSSVVGTSLGPANKKHKQ